MVRGSLQPGPIRALLAIASVCYVLETPCIAGSSAVNEAERYYRHAKYRPALQLLSPVANKDAQVYELLGACYFMEGDAKRAAQMFEAAVALEPSNSRLHHWLGRAYGRRAETSNVISAMRMAAKAHESFERAVALDPANGEAINDLFEYYLQAPGFLGGGVAKAQALAEKILALDPAEYEYAQARLAERRKRPASAEDHLRKAIALAPGDVGRIIDLAAFLERSRRYAESDQAFKRAERLHPGAPRVLFHKAKAYVESHRNVDVARALLKQYLASDLTPDDPSRREAEELLRLAAN